MATIAIIEKNPGYKKWVDEFEALKESQKALHETKWRELEEQLKANGDLPEGFNDDWNIEVDHQRGTIVAHEPHECGGDCGGSTVISGKLPKEFGDALAKLFKGAKMEAANL